MVNPFDQILYWMCTGCGRIINGGPELPSFCTVCGANCWQAPPTYPPEAEE